MGRRAWTAILIGLVVAAVVVTWAPWRKKLEVIKIGAIQPMTGTVASWGQHGERAMRIAVQEINAAGGIRGHQVQLILEDSQGDPKVGVNALKKLIDVDKVPLVIGDAISPVSFATAPIASTRHVVLLSPGSTAALLTREGGNYFFRVMPSDALQSKITAEWIAGLGFRDVAVVGTNNVWGKGLVEFFSREFPKRGGRLALEQLVGEQVSDFRTVIEKIRAADPDAIYAPLYQTQAGQFLRQLKQLGVPIQVFGADVYEAPELLETAGDAANGVLFTTFVQQDNDISRNFRAKYRAEYGMDPINYAYFAYDAMKLAAHAIDEAGYNAARIRQALLRTRDFRGATGITAFDEHGDVTTKTFEKMQIRGGRIVPLKPGSAGSSG
jgi:branched-chain amino acid transport system substrate-binding protein